MKLSCFVGSVGFFSFNHILISFSFSVQFFPTAEEAIDYFNQKRCVDGKALVLPSQIVSQFHFCNACYGVFFVTLMGLLLFAFHESNYFLL